MKATVFSLSRILFIVSIAIVFALAQDKQEPKISQGEAEAVNKVQNAKDVPTKLKAAEELMKKYAKSSLRPKVAKHVADFISDVPDAGQRLTHIENYKKVFSTDSEKDMVLPAFVDALALKGNVDDAFKQAPKAMTIIPDNVGLMTQLAIQAGNQAGQGNLQNAELGKQYGMQAIALIEGDKKPEFMAAEFWANAKKQWLPSLYQALGFISFGSKDDAATKTNFQKVMELDPANPRSYYVMSSLIYNDYQNAALDYNAASGAAKGPALKKAEGLMDQLIELYAQVLGKTDGKAEFKQMYDQILPEMQQMYKYRKGSMDGFQQLVDKHKK